MLEPAGVKLALADCPGEGKKVAVPAWDKYSGEVLNTARNCHSPWHTHPRKMKKELIELRSLSEGLYVKVDSKTDPAVMLNLRGGWNPRMTLEQS